MATFADIILNDGLATPVAHTFKVKINDNRMSTWEDRVNGIPLGYSVVKLTTSDTDTVRKVKISVAMPTLEAVSGANQAGFTPAATIAYIHRATLEFILPQRGTLAERKNLLAFLTNSLSNATIIGVIRDGDEISG